MRYALFIFLFFFVLLYPFYMSIETWGMLPKSQESNQTIEERIAEMIAEHEADPEAHTGENESLEAHRANEILDHRAGSIVADKISPDEVKIVTIFETDTGWQWDGYQKVKTFPGIIFRTNTTNNNSFVFYTEENLAFNSADITKMMLFQVSALLDINNAGDLELNFGGGKNDTGLVGMGFYTTSNVLYGYYNDGDNVYNVNLGTITNSHLYTLRAVYNPATNEIDFWVDSTVEGSIAYVEPDSYSNDMTITFYGKKTRTSSQCALYVYNLTFIRSL